MYVEERFQAERPYLSPAQWRVGLLRTVRDVNGSGCMIWYLPVLDGGGCWGIGWVSALVAGFEGFFTDFQRRDELVAAGPGQDENGLAVLTKGQERLIIAMNLPTAPRQEAATGNCATCTTVARPFGARASLPARTSPLG